MQIFQGSTGQLQLSSRLQTYRAVRAGQGDDIVALEHRAPAIAGQADKQRVDAALLIIGGGMVIGLGIDELLMLGADAPAILGLGALGKGHDQLLAGLDDGVYAP